jgi:endonuclease/exonuclease/phosphatase family metal-dependent hydrolase
MRIVAWNINHRAREKTIPVDLAAAIASLGPDVIVLTEYVDGPTRAPFHASLAQHGFCHLLMSGRRRGENQVLIAARTAFEPGPIFAPEIAPSVPSNALHVRLPQEGLEILGIRVPDYSKALKTKRACWDWILQTASEVHDRPFVMIGDFNTDASYPRSQCGDRFGTLVDSGWQLASPPDGSSFWTLGGHAVRIDHAFVSRCLVVERAAYVTRLGQYVFAGKEPAALSDHAALSIDVTHQPSVPDHSPPDRASRFGSEQPDGATETHVSRLWPMSGKKA